MGWLSDPQTPPELTKSGTNPNEAPGASLHPEDILHYTLKTDSISCACGQVHVTSRLWLTHREGSGRNSRPMGKSETLYAKKEVKQLFTQGGTPVCAVCLDAPRTLEAWTPRPKAGAGTSGKSNFAPGEATERLKKALKASVAERPLSELLD